MKTKLLQILAFFLPITMFFSQDTFLWRIENPKNSHVSYLNGTHHYLTSHYVETFPIIKKKMEEGDAVVFEVDQNISKQNEELFKNRPDNEKLLAMLTFEQRNKAVKHLGEGSLKLTPFQFVGMAAEYNTIYNHPSEKGENIEKYFLHLASILNKKIIYLEKTQQQIEVFEEISQSGKIADYLARKSMNKVVDSLGHPTTKNEMRKSFVKFYDQKQKYYLNSGVPLKFHQTLLKDRNNNWMKILPEILDKHNAFISVGVMHLQYKFGLIAQLMKMGYKLTPIDMKTGKDLPFDYR